MRAKSRKRTIAEKVAIANEYLSGTAPSRVVADRHKIHPATVSSWARQYANPGHGTMPTEAAFNFCPHCGMKLRG